MPEKYHVKAADGSPDLPATYAKVEAARAELERRMGAGEAPPKSADEYKVNVPAALAERIKAEDLAKDPGFKDFLGKLHTAGLNQKQVDIAVGEFLDRSLKLQAGMNQLSADDCTAKLKTEWKTDELFKTGVSSAYRAASAFGDVTALMAKYGNDPDFIRFAANVGKELSEDRGAMPGSQGASEVDIEALTKTKAYWDPKEPDHEATKAKVAAFYAAKYGSAPKQTGSMSFGSALP